MNKRILNGAEAYLDLAGGIIIALDSDGKILFINQVGCKILEAEKEKIINKNWFDHFLPDDNREKIRNLFFQVVHNKLSLSLPYENHLRSSKGNLKFISWFNIVLIDEPDSISGILCLGEDVTEKKLLLHHLTVQEEIKRKQMVTAVLEAQEKERSEIAYELHDGVNQILTTCKLLLEQEMHNGNLSPFISNTTEYIKSAIDEIRNISHRLNPAHIEQISLEQAIIEMTQPINMSGAMKVNVTSRGNDYIRNLDSSIALSVYRILQEQLTNIIKHSGAEKVDISLFADEKAIDVEVADNGKGFDLKKAVKGIGLKSIYSRIELHDGSVYINTAPGEGCTLSIHIPYTADDIPPVVN